MTMSRLMTLLPAPTPTRFIGKMHAVVAQSDKRKASASSDNIPDTIAEVLIIRVCIYGLLKRVLFRM